MGTSNIYDTVKIKKRMKRTREVNLLIDETDLESRKLETILIKIQTMRHTLIQKKQPTALKTNSKTKALIKATP